MSNQTDLSAVVEVLRDPPAALESERSLLGTLLLDNERIADVRDAVTSRLFCDHRHAGIYDAIVAQYDLHGTVNAAVVLDSIGEGASLGMRRDEATDLLAVMLESVVPSTPIEPYIASMRRADRARRLIGEGVKLIQDAGRNAMRPLREVIAEIEPAIMAIAEEESRKGSSFQSLNDVIAPVIDDLAERFESEEEMHGLTTGLRDLDEMLRGLMPSQMVVLAGRPGMGKTAAALKVTEAAAISGGKGVAVFSLEMDAKSLALRMLASVGRIDQDRLRTAQMYEEDWQKLMTAVAILSKAEVFIDETPSVTMPQIRGKLRDLMRKQEIGLVVIDYLQLIGSDSRRENQTAEITEISRQTKLLAKEFKVPVLILSQLNRDVERRSGRPTLADLRGSGAIEQDADVVIFLYRDEYYNKESAAKGMAEWIVAKQREGATGTVMTKFNGSHGRFDNFDSSGAEDEYGNSYR